MGCCCCVFGTNGEKNRTVGGLYTARDQKRVANVIAVASRSLDRAIALLPRAARGRRRQRLSAVASLRSGDRPNTSCAPLASGPPRVKASATVARPLAPTPCGRRPIKTRRRLHCNSHRTGPRDKNAGRRSFARAFAGIASRVRFGFSAANNFRV